MNILLSKLILSHIGFVWRIFPGDIGISWVFLEYALTAGLPSLNT
jgi:hypothetical protein